MTKSKIKPKTPTLRFPGFEGEWEEKRLGEVTSYFQSGKNITSEDISKSGDYPVYGGNGIRGYSNNFNQDGEYFLIGRQGALCGNVNKVKEKAFISEHAIVVKENDHSNVDWLAQKLINMNLNRLSESSAQPGLSVQKLLRLKIILPSKPEQQKIASFLESVDLWIENLKEQKQGLETYKKGMMHRIFSQQIRFKQDDGTDYTEWEEKNGNDIFENISDKNHNSDLQILAITQDLGAVPRDQIDYNISVTDKSIESYKVVKKGDYIISLRSFQGGIEYSNYDGLCSPAYIILRPYKQINSHFYRYYFKTYVYIKRLTRYLEGIRDGKMISFKLFSETEIPFPTLPEQQEIADFLQSLDNLIDQKLAQISKAEEWKKGLMQGLFC